jgi:tetratricopeptide (TPR) repeat protein
MEAKKRKLALEEAKRKKEEAEQKRKEEEEKQKKAERESRLEFETLKKKYRIVSDNNQPTSPLFAILKRVDCHEKLSKKEIEWLINHHHYIFSIQYLTERYERAKDPWDLISAASIYRKIKKPEKALELTNDCIPNDKKSKAAVCTTRGAAYKDLEDLEKARVLAEKAIEYQPDSFYPYNLLGGIYYKLGKPEEGDQYFVKAIELGSTSKAQENEIRNLLETESQEFIQRTVTYLLSKDPKKYRWATYYLKR